uniref:EamA-like transporter family protein n=1 Tax=Candidatus Kentrum sp. TC TaxID=2126339 RepID=A0A450Z699_9GAMM|nr:MAG: EamA-like transporter family protein [Candidatus Kentron sp. TC]
MWLLHSAAGAIVFGVCVFVAKLGMHRGGSENHLLLGLYFSGSIGFLALALENGLFPPSPMVAVVALFMGAGSVFGNLHFVRALQYGPLSLSAPLVNLSTVCIVVLSVVFYDEILDSRKWLAIAIIIIATSLIHISPGERRAILSRRWYGLMGIAILMLTFRNGGLTVAEEAALDTTLVAFTVLCFRHRVVRDANHEGPDRRNVPVRKKNRDWLWPRGRRGLVPGTDPV